MFTRRFIESILRQAEKSRYEGLSRELWRQCGALEVCLIQVGVLGAGKPFPYLKTKHRFLWKTWEESERYPSMIIRKTKEWLSENEKGSDGQAAS